MKNPIIVALDIDDEARAQHFIDLLSPHVGGFKIGPRLTFKSSPRFIKNLSEKSLLFFDHKFFDIPSTTVASVKAAFDLGASWVTVHALNGQETLSELADLQKSLRQKNSHFRILAVTILTSFKQESLPSNFKSQKIDKHVLELAKLGFDSGLDSVVCSPEETESVRGLNREAFLVVPGIRLKNAASDDQKRIATPQEAIRKGANALVIGRPIIDAKDPLALVRQIQGEIS